MKNNEKKQRLLIVLGVIILTFLFTWSLTRGFTRSLNEVFGLQNGSGTMFENLMGLDNFNPRNAVIALTVIFVLFTIAVIMERKK